MDYGQNKQLNTPQDFFTSGVGTNSTSENIFEPENNLDLTNTATSWNMTPGLQSEIAPQGENIQSETMEFTPGNMSTEVVDVVLPPNYQIEPENIPKQSFDPKLIFTGRDRISKATISEAKKVENKLSEDHNAASFYDDIRSMAKDNLKNSYNWGAGNEKTGRSA